MLLTETTDKLQVITSASSGNVDIVINYIDRVTSTGAVGAANRQASTIGPQTTQDILAAPASDTTRKVLSMTFRCDHPTGNIEVIVQLNANSVIYEMHAARLYPDELLSWNAEDGWEHTCRRQKPINEVRMSEGITRVTAVVTGSDVNTPAVANCMVNVSPTLAGGVQRRICSMFIWHDLAAATTTGVALGQLMPFTGFSASNNFMIDSVVANVLAATMTSHDSGAADLLIANGTSAVANLIGIGSGFVQYTEAALPAEPQHVCYLGVQSEVAASQVTIGRGCLFQVFEATD